MPIKAKIEGEIITLAEAVELTTNYRAAVPNGTKSYTVNANLVRQVLDQQGCVDVRIYNGYNTTDNSICLILIGVGANDQDLTGGIILDHMAKCPPRHTNSVLEQ